MARIKADSVKGFTKRTWDTAYSRSIKSTTVSGDSNKTISLNQQNGESILIEGVTDTNYYVTSGSLSQGTLTLTLNGLTDGVDITGFVYNLADINNVASTAPTDGQVLAWDNTNSQWAPTTNADDNDFLTNASINNDTAQVTFSVGSQSDVGLSLSSFKKAASTITVVIANSNFTGNLSALGDNNDNHVQKALEILDDIDGLSNLSDHSSNIVIGTTDKIILKDNSDGYGLVELGSLPASFFDFSEVTFDIGGDETTRGWTLIGNGGVSLAPNDTTDWYTDYGSDYAMLVVTGNVKVQDGGNITDARFIGNLEGDVEGNLIISDTEGVVANRVNAGTTTNVVLFNESVNGQNDTVTISASTYTGFAGSTPEFVGTFQGNLKGQVYNSDGSVLALYTANSSEGNTPIPILQGDISGDIITSTQSGSGLNKVLTKGTTIFDSSEVAFTTNLNIGIPVYSESLGENVITTNYNIDLGATSEIYFGRHIEDGQGVSQEEYINASKISTWDASVLTSSKFQMGQTTGSPQEDLIQFNINGPAGLTSAYSIKPGTYLSASTDTDTHVLLDVDTTALDALYVDIDGDTMEGNLSFNAENIGVVGNIFNTNGTKILENGSDSSEAWFKGRLIGDITDSDLNVIFDSSEGTFKKDIYLEEGTNYYDIILGYSNGAVHFTNDYNPSNQTAPIESLTAAKISSWDAANDKHITNMEFQEGTGTDAGKFELFLTAEDSEQNRTSEWLIEEGSNITMSVTERVNNSGRGAINISAYTNSDPNNGDLGLATVSYVNTKFADDATAIGWDIDGTVTSPTNVNIVLRAEDGLSFVFEAEDTNNPTGYDDFRIRNSKGVEDFEINDITGVLTITKTSAGGTPGTLTANLENYVDSRVSAGAAPSLQQVLDSSNDANVSTTEIRLASSTTSNTNVTDHGVLLARRTETGGDNLIATFDTNGNSGHIRIGSDGSNNDNTIVYGYLGMAGDGKLFLSNASSTSGGILIDGSDNVGIGLIDDSYKFNVNGAARISSNLDVLGVANLNGGISVDTNFSVNGTNGNVVTSGTLSSSDTSISGTLTVTGDSDLQGAVTANSLTVTNNSSLKTVSLSGDLTPSVDSTHDLGTDGLRFANVYTDNLNGVAPGSFANKETVTNQEFDATIIAPDFQLTSDERLKENIIDLKPRKINVDFKEYNFKDTKQTRFGVVAQELEKHHPEFIKESDSGYKSVSYIDLLVAKIVELEDRIKQLENA